MAMFVKRELAPQPPAEYPDPIPNTPTLVLAETAALPLTSIDGFDSGMAGMLSLQGRI
jgi:hypothetical protein